MACELKLQISNYNPNTNKVEVSETTIGNVEEGVQINYDNIAEFIYNLDKETRSTLAAQLRAAKVQKVNNNTWDNHQLISNISLDELVKQYPNLQKYEISENLQHDFTLFKCRSAEFNGTIYKGRAVNSKGQEIFIINDIYDAEKLFKHLQIRSKLIDFIQGNHVDKSLEKWRKDLEIITKHYRRDSIQRLIEDFLINKNAYMPFKIGDKLYNPIQIINEVLSKITNELYDEGDQSALLLALKGIKSNSSKDDLWVFDKKKLYDVLSTFSEDVKNLPFDQFKQYDTNTLNKLLRGLFEKDVHLIKANVVQASQGKQIITEPKTEKRREKVPSEIIQQIYDQSFKPNNPELPKRYQKAAKDLGYKFNEIIKEAGRITILDTTGIEREVYFEMDENYKVTAYYEVESERKIKETGASITIALNKFDPIGKIYNFGYDAQGIYEYVKQYKGFYIYAFDRDGVTHYAISRSIISPNSYMQTYSSIDRAIAAIDKNKDTLEQCGLYSIKQFKGTPRVSKIEMKNIRKGSIITTLDLNLPNYVKNNFSDTVKLLLKGTVSDFQDKLRGIIDNIDQLDTPEKATAFIYLAHDALKTGQDFIQALRENPEKVQEIITKINNSKPISYFVEKIDNFGKAYLKLLKNNGTNVIVNGEIQGPSIQDSIDQNLNELITYFRDTLGIETVGMSRSDLEKFNKDNNLGMENKLDTINAFVYNGKIHVVTSNANAENLFHELTHIFLGALKVSDPEAYHEIIRGYSGLETYKRLHTKHKQIYQHYSEEDIAEETVADIIADKLFQAKQLGTNELKGDQVFKLFEEIFKISNRFTESVQNNGLGFQRYITELLNEDTKNAINRNMKISNLVQQLIRDKKIIEDCK